jgi:hypothetical protein
MNKGGDDDPIIDRKANTITSMYIGSTIAKPNVEAIINAVATILHSQMLEDQSAGKTISEKSDLYFFSEEKYIKEKPEAFDE